MLVCLVTGAKSGQNLLQPSRVGFLPTWPSPVLLSLLEPLLAAGVKPHLSREQANALREFRLLVLRKALLLTCSTRFLKNRFLSNFAKTRSDFLFPLSS
jgi:hypothetical protein